MSIDHGKLLALSPEAIEAGWRATFSTDNPFCPCDLKTFAKAARWAERALAQPAEAVEGGKCRMCGAPCTEHKREIAPGDYVTSYRYEADATQGAVAPWRAFEAAIDTKALATAQEIALMWGQDRAQFVARIQVAVTDAMRWAAGSTNPQAAPAQDETLLAEIGERAYKAGAVAMADYVTNRPALKEANADQGDAVEYPDATGWAGPGHARVGDACPACPAYKSPRPKLVAEPVPGCNFARLNCEECGAGSYGLHYPPTDISEAVMQPGGVCPTCYQTLHITQAASAQGDGQTEKNAARYLYLRNAVVADKPWICGPNTRGYTWLHGDAADMAIDAELAAAPAPETRS